MNLCTGDYEDDGSEAVLELAGLVPEVSSLLIGCCPHHDLAVSHQYRKRSHHQLQ